MPEGPSIVIVREQLKPFKGLTVQKALGNAAIDKSGLEGERFVAIKSWGKHLLICFRKFTLRIHFLMFGTYLIDERKKTPLKLSLRFARRELNFYTCSVVLFDGRPETNYDFSADIMNKTWSPRRAAAKLKSGPERLVCDALMDQEIFSGAGNIIKNEVLFRIRVHPASQVGDLPATKRSELLRQIHRYPFEFLKWKKAGELDEHLEAYGRKICPRDHVAMHKASLGKLKRTSHYCDVCQVKYGGKKTAAGKRAKKS